MGRVKRSRGSLAVSVSVAGLVLCVGCAGEKRARPQPIQNAFGPVTIAVAPAINQSGSSEFDANRFADVMAAELGAAPNVRVTPVSRVLAVLSTDGHDAVMSP